MHMHIHIAAGYDYLKPAGWSTWRAYLQYSSLCKADHCVIFPTRINGNQLRRVLTHRHIYLEKEINYH